MNYKKDNTMKIRVTIIFVLAVLSLKAQYRGYHSDNYNGIHGVLSNPANIVDSRMRTDINLFSINAFLANDYAGVNVSDVFKNFSEFNFEKDAKENPLNDNKFFLNVDALLPSFMFNLSSKSSVAVFSRFRMVANIAKIDGKLFEALQNDFEKNRTSSIDIDGINPKVAAHAWAEIGATYARVFMNQNEHFLKGGFTVKYLLGAGSGYMSGNDVKVKVENNTMETGGKLVGAFSGTIAKYMEGGTDILKDLKLESRGVGADIGFVYEWRPDYKVFTGRHENKYKLKLGISITDIGKISYKNNDATTYDLNRTPITIDNYKQAGSFREFLDNNFNKTKSSKSLSGNLPTTLHLLADWKINHYFYLNVNADLALKNSELENMIAIPSSISVTPRIEKKWFGLYSPISYDSYKQLTWGVGMRLGPLLVGSNTLLSNMTSKNSKEANVYIGLKIPVYRLKSSKKIGIETKEEIEQQPEL